MKDIQLVVNVVNIICLVAFAIEDIKVLSILRIRLFSYLGFGAVAGIFLTDIMGIVLVSIPGFVLIFLSYISEEKLGLADGITVLGNSLILGSPRAYYSLIYSMMVLFIFSVICIFVYRIRHKNIDGKRIPFIPFILIGSLLCMVI